MPGLYPQGCLGKERWKVGESLTSYCGTHREGSVYYVFWDYRVASLICLISLTNNHLDHPNHVDTIAMSTIVTITIDLRSPWLSSSRSARDSWIDFTLQYILSLRMSPHS